MVTDIDVIFVDDEEHLRNAVSQKFELAGLCVRSFADAQSALAIITPDSASVVVSDVRMPLMDGLQLLDEVLELDQDIPVILLTGHGDIKLAVNAMRIGAYDFLEKPFDPDHLVEVTKNAMRRRSVVLENRILRSKLSNTSNIHKTIIGSSPFAKNLRASIEKTAQVEAGILITGATGTGKNTVARAVHIASERQSKPFTVIDCGAISDDQMDVTLFGYEQGAFTGAMRSRFGKLEAGNGGTILFDGIDKASTHLQAKLVAVLEQRAVQRLGSNEVIKLDVRFVASSHVDLADLVESNNFRSDLFHRLRTIELNLVRLSDRSEDLPQLFEQLIQEASIRHGQDIKHVPEKYLSRLLSHEWPGNIRELKQEAEKFVLGFSRFNENGDLQKAGPSLSERMMILEKQVIVSELSAHNGVLKSVQESLGISRKSLYEKMRKFGLDKMRFR